MRTWQRLAPAVILTFAACLGPARSGPERLERVALDGDYL